MNNQTSYGWLKEFCEKNELPFYGLHSFRHFAASALISAGLDVTTVSGALGHSNSTTTIPVPNSNTKPVAVPTEIIMLFNSDLMRLHARDRYFSFFMTPKR